MDERPLYDQIGGDPVVRALVDRFYDEMDSAPTARTIRAMHPPELTESRDKLYWFLSGWLGGPPLYVERKGHPRLRARHLPFAVNADAAEQWMACMRVALAEHVPDAQLREGLDSALDRLAHHMQNQ